MAETATRPRRASRGTVTTSEVNVQPVGQAGSQDSGGGGIKGTIKKHPYATSAVAALGVSAAYLLYKHFKSASSAATTTGATTSGFPLNTGSGTRRGGGAGGIGSGAGSGGGGSGNGSTGTTTTGSNGSGTVDLSGLTSLFGGLQSEIGLLGQEISALGSKTPSTGSSGGGGGVGSVGTVSPAPAVIQVAPGLAGISQTGNFPGATVPTNTNPTVLIQNTPANAPAIVGPGLGQGSARLSTSTPTPAPAKSTASTPSPATNQHVSAGSTAVNTQAPKAQAVTNTQAAHAQQTAKVAAKPAPAPPAAGHTGIRAA